MPLPRERDWRTRWRRRPAWGWSPDPSALLVSYILWDSHASGKSKERRLKKDSLLKITTTPDREPFAPKNEVCEHCGEKILPVAALPVCPELVNADLLAKERSVGAGLGLPKELRAMKVGRNEPCPCGSGKKFKKCCAGREQ